MEPKKKSLEDFMVPCKVPEGWSAAKEMMKMVEEMQEATKELRAFYAAIDELQECVERGDKKGVEKWTIQASLSKQLAAVETGDVIQVCVTLLDLLGFSLMPIMEVVYEKNASRGYYTKGAENVKS